MERRTHDGRKFRTPCAFDAFPREAPAIPAKPRPNSSDVLEVLGGPMPARGTPSRIRSDDGPELAAPAVRAWLANLGVDTAFAEPGSPSEDGDVESFASELRAEPPDGGILHSLEEARIPTGALRRR